MSAETLREHLRDASATHHCEVCCDNCRLSRHTPQDARQPRTAPEGPIDDATLLRIWREARERVHVSCDECHVHRATAGCLSGDPRDIDLCRFAETLDKERSALRALVAKLGAQWGGI